MDIKNFEKTINKAWDVKDQINSKSNKKILSAIGKTIDLLDVGKIRVAEKKNNEWNVNQWIKKAILLSFKINKITIRKFFSPRFIIFNPDCFHTHFICRF